MMIGWAIAFLILAVIAALLGFWMIVGIAAMIAKIAFYVFLILFVIYVIRYLRRKHF